MLFDVLRRQENRWPIFIRGSTLGRSRTRWHLAAPRLYSASIQDQVIFSGIQPTGIPHLGNYLGALRQWRCLQNEAPTSTKLLFSVVDLHAITIQPDADQLRRRKRETLAALIAVGLDPERSTIFYQSAVWDMSCAFSIPEDKLKHRRSRSTQSSCGYWAALLPWVTSPAWHNGRYVSEYRSVFSPADVNLNVQSKLALSDQTSAFDSQAARAKLRLGLFSYPVLQAADILLYG